MSCGNRLPASHRPPRTNCRFWYDLSVIAGNILQSLVLGIDLTPVLAIVKVIAVVGPMAYHHSLDVGIVAECYDGGVFDLLLSLSITGNSGAIMAPCAFRPDTRSQPPSDLITIVGAVRISLLKPLCCL
jgi:hypothetical protein